MNSKQIIILFSLFFSITFSSCTNETSEKNLSKEDHAFIESLGILEPEEEIELFESNGGWDGIKAAGAFITSQRIAYYWIEDGEKEINAAFFATDIDSIALTDLSSKLTYASYLTVYQRTGSSFKVYIDADSTRVKAFYDLAQNNLKKYRTNEFSLNDFLVKKGSVGKIKIGDRISDHSESLKKLQIKSIEAIDFGFDGGGEAYLYSYNNEAVFGIVPAYHTDSIIGLIVLHPKLKTNSNISVGMTVKELMKLQPEAKVQLNLMNDWEEINDNGTSCFYVFKTDESNRIGDYSTIDEEVQPTLHLSTKITWIQIQ